MAFRLGNIVIDRVQYGVAEDSNGKPLYTLSQLDDSVINIASESKEAKDREGNLIKKFWLSKSGTFEAKNALMNVDVMAATAGGTGITYASSSDKITMPKIVTVKSGSTVKLTNYVEGSVFVYAYGTNGAMGTVYKKGTTASATEYALTAEGVLTPPTDTNETVYVVKYNRTVEEGVSLVNSADKFPETVKLTLKALCVDPCEADTLRACYIVLPSFQVSPEVSINLTTESQIDYKGDLQVDYCSTDKKLYQFFYAPEDEEE